MSIHQSDKAKNKSSNIPLESVPEVKPVVSSAETEDILTPEGIAPFFVAKKPISQQLLIEQINYAFALIQSAFASKIAKLELELQKCKQENIMKDNHISEMEEKLIALVTENNESIKENKEISEENEQLKKANKALEEENKELNKMRSMILTTLGTTIDATTCTGAAISFDSGGIASSPQLFTKFGKEVLKHSSKQNPASLKQKQQPCSSNTSSSLSTSKEGPDGKYFFALIKERLPSDKFDAFIQNLKRYKNKEATKAESIIRAKEIFGEENMDLFQSFQQLMLS